jgi:hypothetical protein
MTLTNKGAKDSLSSFFFFRSFHTVLSTMVSSKRTASRLLALSYLSHLGARAVLAAAAVDGVNRDGNSTQLTILLGSLGSGR